jgi:hypothetical protein
VLTIQQLVKVHWGANTTASDNVAVGLNALAANTTGYDNTVIGRSASYVSTTATNNTVVGKVAGGSLTTGGANTFMGETAGYSFTTGSNNICIGYLTGAAEYSAGQYRINIGDSVNAGGNNTVNIGKSGNIITNNFTNANGWSQSSDERKKQNITNDNLGLSFINRLRTVKYNWKPSNEFPNNWRDYNETNQMDTEVVMHGLVAQEVKQALDDEGVSTFGGWSLQDDGMQLVSKEMFVLPLIKALQEADAKIDALITRIEALEG